MNLIRKLQAAGFAELWRDPLNGQLYTREHAANVMHSRQNQKPVDDSAKHAPRTQAGKAHDACLVCDKPTTKALCDECYAKSSAGVSPGQERTERASLGAVTAHKSVEYPQNQVGEVEPSPRSQKEAGNEDLFVTKICRELYDRFVMGGWEPWEAAPLVREYLAELRSSSPHQVERDRANP